MSDPTDPNTNLPTGGGPVRGGSLAPGWRQRPKSVNLRDEDPDQPGYDTSMDPATQSLSDALRITYRIVQFAVLALVGLYALSGFRTVGESENGMRLLFGKIQEKDIGPGFRFSWPEPLGELLKVNTGTQDIIINDDFFPELSAEEKKAITDKGTSGLGEGGRDKLNPELDGSNVTGDGNIGHTRWAVRYTRSDSEKFVTNIDPASERAIVIGAVKRGIVRASASVSIDELLKGVRDPGREAGEHRMDEIAKKIAQQTLDDLGAGITLDVVSVTARIAPRRTAQWFTMVNKSYAEQKKMIEEAAGRQNETLTETAGEAWKQILMQIDQYEAALALKDKPKAEATLAIIDSLLAGERVVIDGQEFSYRVYGKVTDIVNEARGEKARVINQLKGETASFGAKRDLFSGNRQVFLNTEWADAFGSFVASQSVQQLMLPMMGKDGRMVVTIGRDPEVNNRIIRELNRQAADKARIEREKNAERERFNRRNEPITISED